MEQWHCFCPQRVSLTPTLSALVLKLVNLVPVCPWHFCSYPVLELRVSKFVSLCAGTLRAAPWSSIALCLSDTIPNGFYSQMYGDSSSCHWCPELRSSLWGCDPSLFSGDLCSQDIPLDFQSPCLGVCPDCFVSLSLLPV